MKEEGYVLLSKLQLPNIHPRTLHRGRLINHLIQNMHKKLIVLYAGAGYGKTTLISQFIRETNVHYVYYQLKKDDDDPSIFLPHLITGIQRIYPEFGSKVQKLSQFFNLPQGMFSIVLGTFINELIQTIKEDMVIIFDDYHSLKDSSMIDNVISYLLENLPQRIHIIISSRNELPISLTQLRAKDELLELTTDTFRFTKEETDALLTAVFALKLDSSELNLFYEYSKGWPACLRLMLQSYEITPQTEKIPFFERFQNNYKQITENIFDYFSQEVFRNESEEVQQFLVDCSLLDYLSPELCTTITGKQDSHKILERLARQNTFVFSLPDGNYRIHPLFQDFLKSKLSDEARKKKIYHCLAEFLMNMDKENALKYYLLAEDFILAAKTIEIIGKRMLEQGRYTILVSAIENLPDDVRDRNPLILKYYGEALGYLGNQSKAKEFLVKALGRSKKNWWLNAEIIYSLAGVCINEGNLRLAKKYLKKLLKICPNNLHLLKASALNSLGAIYNTIGGKMLSRAKVFFKTAYKITERYNYQDLKASILNNWAMNAYKQGSLNDAYIKLITAIRLLKDHFSVGCGAGFYNGARISILQGDINGAETILQMGSNICQTYNDPWSMANIWRGYGLLNIEKNDLKKAKEYYNKALEFYKTIKVPWLIITTLSELSRIEIMENNLSEAERILQKIYEYKKTGDDAESIPILLLEAELKIAREEFSDAEKILIKAKRLSKKFNLGLENFLTSIGLCIVLYKQDKKTQAEKNLKKVIETAKNKEYDFLLLKELKKDPEVMDLIIKKRIKLLYIYSILKKYKIFYIINVSFFGSPSLEINGKSVQDREWKTEKSKKLFFYLLLNNKRSLNQENLIDIFWHKAGLKQGYDSLRKAIQHIRITLKGYGIDDPIFVHSGFYQISPDLYIISDIEEFEKIINEFKKTGYLQNSQYQRLIDIYKNGFAQSWYDNWAVELADKYQSLFEGIRKTQIKK